MMTWRQRAKCSLRPRSPMSWDAWNSERSCGAPSVVVNEAEHPQQPDVGRLGHVIETDDAQQSGYGQDYREPAEQAEIGDQYPGEYAGHGNGDQVIEAQQNQEAARIAFEAHAAEPAGRFHLDPVPVHVLVTAVGAFSVQDGGQESTHGLTGA